MIRLGDSAQVSRGFDAADLAAFQALTHWPAGAEVPDPLIGALFSCLLGARLPGPGTGWLKQDLRHHATAHLDEVLTARVTVTRLRPAQRLIDLACTCHGADGRLICDGRALMLMAPDPSGQQPQPPGAVQQHPHR